MSYHILEIAFGTPEYDEAVHLRYEVLRKPLGLEFTPEQLAAEFEHFHIGAYHNQGELLGYLNLTPLGDGVVKMRQVAVAPTWQGAGIGTAMVRYSEQFAVQRGFHKMVLHARETAVPFYLRLGYSVEGERFEEVSIPHFKMYKALD